MRLLAVIVVLSLLAASLIRTTITSRRILRRSLGRKLESGEETSLKSWMKLSSNDLDAATKELERDPFDSVLKAVDDKGLFHERRDTH